MWSRVINEQLEKIILVLSISCVIFDDLVWLLWENLLETFWSSKALFMCLLYKYIYIYIVFHLQNCQYVSQAVTSFLERALARLLRPCRSVHRQFLVNTKRIIVAFINISGLLSLERLEYSISATMHRYNVIFSIVF